VIELVAIVKLKNSRNRCPQWAPNLESWVSNSPEALIGAPSWNVSNIFRVNWYLGDLFFAIGGDLQNFA
jgi:hypothetical protein